MGKNIQTICWDCAKATGGCSWSDELKPVDGWTAAPCQASQRFKPYDSYVVIRCPMFDRDSLNGGQEKLLKIWGKGKKHENGNNRKRTSAAAANRVAKSHGSDRVDIRRDRVAVQSDEPERDVIELSFGIVEQAVKDWKALDYGKRAEVVVDGIMITRREVVRFFFSEWFYHLIKPFPYTPRQIRKALKIPEDALQTIDSNDAEERRLKWLGE